MKVAGYRTLTDGQARLQVTEVCGADNRPDELFVVAAAEPTADFDADVAAIACALDRLDSEYSGRFATVYMRVMLSDPANQSAAVRRVFADRPLSIVGQPPAGSSRGKIAVFARLVRDARVSHLPSGLWRCVGPQDRELLVAAGRTAKPAPDGLTATEVLLGDYTRDLAAAGADLAADCHRTWFFVRDIDLNYPDVVDGRNRVFDSVGLTRHTHFIASTGICGRPERPDATVSFDAIAYTGPQRPAVTYLQGASHLGRTSDYGVAFERGVALDFARGRYVLISGTASIDPAGNIVHPGDVRAQTARMCSNVDVLLAEGGAGPADVTSIVAYVRDFADGPAVERILRARYPGVPLVVVCAAVCRPGWLVEMECVAAL